MTLERGEYLAAAGVLSMPTIKAPWDGYIDKAAEDIGKGYVSDYQRNRLIEAVKKSVINRKRYPFKTLSARYSLTISEAQFHIEKQRFVHRLAELAGWT